MIFPQLIANGLIAGSIYALVASGFSLIYATNRFLHLAHGTTVTVAAYLLYTLFALVGLPFWIAVGGTIIGAALLGWLMHVAVYQPLRMRGSSNAVLLVASIGILIFLENLMLLVYGADVKTVGYIDVQRGMDVLGATVTGLQLVIVLVSLALLAGLYVLTRHTRLGKRMRAVADNPELAQISGINTQRVRVQGYLLGSGIAGVAGVLVALEQNVEPVMGTMLIVKGFTGAVIGGITSLPGSVLGSYVLGLVENIGIWWLPSGWKDAIAFGLLFIFLLVRPSGLLGIRRSTR